jgi:hypothetical protein
VIAIKLQVRFQFLMLGKVSNGTDFDVVSPEGHIFKGGDRPVLRGSPDNTVVFLIRKFNHCLAIEKASGVVEDSEYQN